MKVSELGEFKVIDLLMEKVTRERSGDDSGSPYGFHLVVDVGDDAAAWAIGRGTELCTTDTAVEGVHFTPATTPWYDMGWKIIAANASDIAAMGGVPLYALITLGLPPETEVESLESLYAGMVELANRHGVAIVGGDVVRSSVLFVTVVLTGVTDGEPLLRSAAEYGDMIAVTGYLGSAAGGLRVMVGEIGLEGESAERLKVAHRMPEPCVKQGRTLSRSGVRAAIDISDGLVDDLSKLCLASGVSAELDVRNIPVHSALRDAFREEYLDLALNGGEDYELLFTAPEALMGSVLAELGSPAAVIGRIVKGESGEVVILDSHTGKMVKAVQGGWDHFGSSLQP